MYTNKQHRVEQLPEVTTVKWHNPNSKNKLKMKKKLRMSNHLSQRLDWLFRTNSKVLHT